jgi:hypothetical protein
MPLPPELWPGRGSWQIGPPPEEQRRQRRRASRQARQKVAPSRVMLRRWPMSRLRWGHRRNDRDGAPNPPGAPRKEEAR